MDIEVHPLGFGLGWKFHHHLVHFVNCHVSYCSHPSVGGGYLCCQYNDLEFSEWCFELMERLRLRFHCNFCSYIKAFSCFCSYVGHKHLNRLLLHMQLWNFCYISSATSWKPMLQMLDPSCSCLLSLSYRSITEVWCYVNESLKQLNALFCWNRNRANYFT